MLRILESQAPAKQTATDTIATLSSRLQSATLLEDRRNAILGLRSFAKLFPASVASGALRDLIASIRKDAADSDTTKVVLETLLMLFTPDERSTEASEEISLWLADEFTQRQDNITVLLDLLESKEFYLRLYSLQLISQIAAARPERTQECIFTAPLGVSRLVAVLDDRRDAVRNEALLLLVALTPSSTELQKVVAFENAFDRIFAQIESEGSLTHGSSTVQDCLSLLANLLKLNVSNQSYFREIGCIRKLTTLLANVSKEEHTEDGVSEWARPQRDMNVWGLLSIVQLFLVRGGKGTPLNQASFWQNGMAVEVLQLAFKSELNIKLKAKCLATCADLIRGNGALQEQFGDLAVPKRDLIASVASGRSTPAHKPGLNGTKTPNGQTTPKPVQMINVIEALLQLALEPAPIAVFDVRLAATECVKAFFAGHNGIRVHVLRRAIDGYRTGEDEIPNILAVLMESPDDRRTMDPYQNWMASVLLFHLLYDHAEAKTLALSVSEGEAANGEEVITCLQAITENLITSVRRGEDERFSIAYLMLLSGWLFEEPDAVNDFLGESSSVQSLINTSKVSTSPIVSGLCVVLLAIIYEFSSKDSPIPRPALQKLLVGYGREHYIDRLTKLRENAFVRDFEVLPQSTSLDGGLPEVFFDRTFVEFLKDNFSRLSRAIDRDPGLEVSVLANGVHKGISRELVDGLRAQVDEQTKKNSDVEAAMLSLRREFEQEQLDHRRTRDSTAVELGRIKHINESLQNNHEQELRQIAQRHSTDQTNTLRAQQQAMAEKDRQMSLLRAEVEESASSSRARTDAEIADLQKNVDALEAQLAKAQKDHGQDLQTLQDEHESKLSSQVAKAARAEEKAADAEDRVKRLSTELERARTEGKKLEEQLEENESAREDVQTELDDLLVVFSDLEAKRAADKSRLKTLGEEVSEDEEDDPETA